jgi:hypothetical protein
MKPNITAAAAAAVGRQVRINPETSAEVAAAHRPPNFIQMWHE